ncbi:MAG: hypothetical protein FIB01_03995 [Gemmatimonadetes bacterium]|nr:hypothetical protein [Gemmatimonadota bacterium]
MSARRLAGALLVLLAACDSAALPPRPSADVYEFRLATTPPRVLHWPSGNTVRIYVAGGTVDGQAGALASALAQGPAAWNRSALFGEYRLAATAELAAADVLLRWSGEASPVDLSQCPPGGTRAVTTFCLNSGRDRLQAFPLAAGGMSRVKMVVTILPSQLTIPGRVPVLVTHELGHVLGIARHSDEPRDLMYDGELSVTLPSRRDQATVQVMYQTAPEIVP